MLRSFGVYALVLFVLAATGGAMFASLAMTTSGGLAGWVARRLPGEAEVPAEEAAPDAVIVRMNNALKFEPEVVTITIGQRVLWVNESFETHTVTCDPAKAASRKNVNLPAGAKAFDSGQVIPDQTYEYTFTTPGEYGYFCIPHEATGMTGRVVVEGG